MVNAPGTVDAGFRGELQVILINHDPKEAISFKKGDRIAQLIIQQVERADFIEVQSLPGSDRGAGGFGSTGGKS
jgi:dUTP pyrophosphatase